MNQESAVFGGVARKLGLSVLLCVAPIGFLLWMLFAEQNIAIVFASKEAEGARYLAALAPVQASAALAAVKLEPAPPGAAAAVQRVDAAFGIRLETGSAAAKAAEAFASGKPGSLAAGRTALRELIARIGDRSNLILDNVLDSYYLTDVVLNRLPEVLDRTAELALLTKAGAGQSADPEVRAGYLIALGGLTGAVDGMDSSMASVQENNGDGSLAAALAAPYSALSHALGAYAGQLRENVVKPDQIPPLLEEVAQLNTRAASELIQLLNARVSGLQAKRWRVLGGTGILFALALAGASGGTGPSANGNGAAYRRLRRNGRRRHAATCRRWQTHGGGCRRDGRRRRADPASRGGDLGGSQRVGSQSLDRCRGSTADVGECE